ncbi:GAF domain-containing protein [Streptomyces ipomoeae]|jgi:GAF domain-containing protein|uniref:GAF domain protein n=2 Tax=Streptomyces ipomoeae TaxID=103232 RepID=L1KSM9_9ACTN|nr:GAF domain-containing protein [Streptomyces ipomoeae]EKX63569.1 GAF domain protein [Streptomyces ipomoeae 91-03]MDX2694765.1 GAF domain-containing protein [Streptomyces ipomoeae]MDX2825001.1 GAF domain-containing protein [Streptomyces ipomoeae]MDX2843312.1 GAF domain-containing protein [Streptomyces ipomoeae]MDX2879483.1 GAF domain-containing protein [Streptomyces ipomoeae]
MYSNGPYSGNEPPLDRLLLTPEDPGAPQRAARLAQLGLRDTPRAEFDEFARRLALELDAPYAMVNFIDDRRQFFAGLYTPEAGPVNVAQRPMQDSGPSVGREMGLDHGFCPHTVKRTTALVLDDVCDYPRFAGNPVVDEIGIRSYMGAPLVDRLAGINLGTICVVDTDSRTWGRQRLEIIKHMAQEMADTIQSMAAGH